MYEVCRLYTQLIVELIELFDLGPEGMSLSGLVAVGLFDALLKRFDFILQGIQQSRKALLVFLFETLALVVEYFIREVFKLQA